MLDDLVKNDHIAPYDRLSALHKALVRALGSGPRACGVGSILHI